MNKVEKNNIPKLKKKKYKVLKILLICFASIILSVIGFIAITDIIADYPEPTDFYFVRYRFDYDTDTGTSTIYQYDADEDEVYEIGSVPGALVKSAVNPEHTHIIGILDGRKSCILYNLQNKEIEVEVYLEEIGIKVNETNVTYSKFDFDFSDDGNSIYMIMQTEGLDKLYEYNLKEDEITLLDENAFFSHYEYGQEYVLFKENGNVSKYYFTDGTISTVVDIKDDIKEFTQNFNGEKILLDSKYNSWQCGVYIYDAQRGTQCVEKGYSFCDMTWLGETYVYVETYPGLLCDVNPTIKINTSRFGPDKVIYRIKGFMKGGTIYLVENPGQ